METRLAFRHGSGTFRHNKKEAIIGSVQGIRSFSKMAAESLRSFRHGSGTSRHDRIVQSALYSINPLTQAIWDPASVIFTKNSFPTFRFSIYC